jgi:hypothetical protein
MLKVIACLSACSLLFTWAPSLSADDVGSVRAKRLTGDFSQISPQSLRLRNEAIRTGQLYYMEANPAVPRNFVLVGDGTLSEPLLQINADGAVYYRGRLLGTDREIYDGVRAAFNPWGVCKDFERHGPWPRPKP